ncbi:MAG: DUF4280 domain-containing protein, partial [Moheibacter sp.]
MNDNIFEVTRLASQELGQYKFYLEEETIPAEKQTTEEEQEQSSGTASEHDKKYVVIQKGQAQCSQGTDFPQFKVQSHQLQHANGDTQDHLIVTEEDVLFNPPTTSFAKSKCTYLTSQNGGSPTPCAYAPGGKWKKTYEKMKVMDKQVVTEISELDCPIVPPQVGKITIFKHGQTQEATAAHFNNVTEEELLMISPLAEKPEEGKEIPKVKYIKATAQETKATQKSNTTKKDVKDNEKLEQRTDKVTAIKVKLGEMVNFEVTDWWNKAKADKALTCWEVLHSSDSNQDWNDPILINYEQKGEKLERDFDSPGYYRVFAYGNPDS